MGLIGTFLGVLGFVFGLPLGLVAGFYFFVYSQPKNVEDPKVRPLRELDTSALQDILPEIPLWIKSPDYDRVDWLNKFLSDMWPYLDKAICANIRIIAEPFISEYVGKYSIEAIEFETLNLGTLPPTIQGIKVYETNEKELVMEPAVRWAGNPNIVLCLTFRWRYPIKIRVQLVDLQVYMAPRIRLRPLVPTFPCFTNAVVSLMEKPYIDFGLNILGGDVMSIPGLYRLVQEMIKKQVANLYLWPQALEIPILDASTAAVEKPVGILHVKVVRAIKLLKMDILGASDPYVKLTLTGDNHPARKTSIKRRNLNPEWNEEFNLIVKDPQSQILHLQVYDWDKVGAHDKLGMQMVPLNLLKPHENQEFTLELLKDTDISEHHHKKSRGQMVLELMFVPFKGDGNSFKDVNSFNDSIRQKSYVRMESDVSKASHDSATLEGAGLLSVVVVGAQDVEGEKHNNPYALVIFRGEKKKTKVIKKSRDPLWNEEFQFMLDEPPLHDKIRVEVISKRSSLSSLTFRSKEPLGHVDINLDDILQNGRINEKYHLIDSKNGMVQVEIRWTTV
ncbi:hypothetical protein MLD38_002567 [Melastoma candidum]|uniref:Uncharacterized protein n=1 Tax=Melastoma candidum TaxID=119954 RepID=A0ACB9RZE7_9MYRT|nr:hypothetical protein MLD38_002567 [Melastoma candidum]